MGRPFRAEIEQLPLAMLWASNLDISAFKRVIKSAADHNLLVVGSGGSSTAAVFMATLHEHYFGDVSRPLTPLEYVVSAPKLENSFTVLLSAEGKNKDIIGAAALLADQNLNGVLLTLTKSNPLIAQAVEKGSPTSFSYDMPWIKDGYLATNSLIAMMIIVARAYLESESEFRTGILGLSESWLNERQQVHLKSGLWRKFAPNQPIIVLFGEHGKAAAVDIESKFAESALGFCQAIDYRQFAHGRHLQLNRDLDLPIILALVSPQDEALARATLNLLPTNTTIHEIALPQDPILAEIVGVIEAILLIDAVATGKNIDPGQPSVPEFGRKVHALNFSEFLKRDTLLTPTIFQRKWPLVKNASDISVELRNSYEHFVQGLQLAQFRGLVCDFDGTFCDTNLRYEGLSSPLILQIERILASGILIGFATGRGDSLLDDLRSKIKKEFWTQILIGYYSGSDIHTLDENFVSPLPDIRFAELEKWLRSVRVITEENKIRANSGQMGIACGSIQGRTHILSAINYWIGSTQLQGWRAYASGHSIDVITENVGKLKVVEEIAKRTSSNPQLDILRIGDSGQFDGNDFELLNDGIGLSVASVSPLPDVAWNLLPAGTSNAAGTLYYLSNLKTAENSVSFRKEFFSQLESDIEAFWSASGVKN